MTGPGWVLLLALCEADGTACVVHRDPLGASFETMLECSLRGYALRSTWPHARAPRCVPPEVVPVGTPGLPAPVEAGRWG